MRSEMKPSPQATSRTLPRAIFASKLARIRCAERHAALLHQAANVVAQLAALETLELNRGDFALTGCAARVIADPSGESLELAVPLADLINIDQERTRLQRELTDLEKRIQSSEARLANPNFINKAPAHIVDEHRQTLDELKNTHAALQQSLSELH